MRFLYPFGKEKALTMSYDDGNMPDLRLVSLFNKYNVKATFNLNSMRSLSEHTPYELRSIYKGHEIACHGLEHKWPTRLSPTALYREVACDKAALEEVFHTPVRGMAYAFGDYNAEVIRTVKGLGIHYARTCEETQDFGLPEDFIRWTPSCHHNNNLSSLADRFLDFPGWYELPLFYVWGHSYEFDGDGGIGWNEMEEFLQKVSGRENIYYATNIEIYDYITAVRSAEFWDKGRRLYNPSAWDIYIENNAGKKVKLGSRKSVII